MKQPIQETPPPPASTSLRQLLEDRVRRARETAAQPTIQRRPPGCDRLPLSKAQERIWFLEQLQPEACLYNISLTVGLDGRLQVPALSQALAGVAARHETLRTAFVESDGRPLQVVARTAAIDLPVVDLAGLPARRRDAELGRIAAADGLTRFDLTRPPLLRARLLRLEATSWTLALVVHHLVFDGWSRGVLLRELSALYRAAVGGGGERLPELPMQFGDFALWERDAESSDSVNEDLRYWRRVFADGPPVLDLPTDRPRPAIQSFEGGMRVVDLSPDLAADLETLAGRHNASLFMVLLAGWVALLSRYSGSGDLVVGTSVANRERAELEGLVGFFVNTLALRLDVSGDPSAGELVDRVRNHMLDALAHQRLPFARLVEELAPERSLSHAPLVQVGLTLQNAPPGTLELPEVTAGRAETTHLGRADQDLALYIAARGGGFSAKLLYRRDLYDGTTAARMLVHLDRLLAAMVARPADPLSALPVLTPAEHHQLAFELAGDGARFPVEQTLHRRFRCQAAQQPEAVALVSGADHLSYGELDRRSDRLSRHVARLGVGPEARVGLLLDRSADLMTAVLAILKTGAAYVPIDPVYPAARAAFILADAGARVVVTDTAHAPGVEAPGRTLVLVDADRDAIDAEPADAVSVPVWPDNLAYVIYTSGSTGRPKGTLVTHRNVMRLLAATQGSFGFGPGDAWTLFHSIAFDVSVFETWGAFAYGGRLVLVPHDVTRSPEGFYRLLADERVTVLSQTPSAFRGVELQDRLRPEPEAESLRWVIFAGEALDVAGLTGWFARRGDRRPRMVNMYGITETTVHVTFRVVEIGDLETPWRSPVGRAMPDLSLYVLDRRSTAAPLGVPGDLHVAGPGVCRGYLERPALTAERFVPHPVPNRPGERVYRSGDLARWIATGELEYVGRIDHQVKVRGFRIELGEIVAVLSSHPAVRDATVVPRGRDAEERRLVAYVVTDGPLDVAVLREHARARLPEYMVPGAWVYLPALPLTANGKLDRAALPEPEAAGVERSGGFTPPRNPLEDLLAALYAELLNLSPVGVDDSFFDLGGHSLLAIRLVARIRAATGVQVAPSWIFEAPTVEALARRLAAHRRSAVDPAPPAIVPLGSHDRVEASFGQERLWLLQKLDPQSIAYNVHLGLRMEGDLDHAALRRALATVIGRHAALRTRFPEVGGAPVQSVVPPEPVPLPVADLRNLSEGEAVADLAARLRRPFDLARRPPVRAVLGRLSGRSWLLAVSIHHIAFDEWSRDVFLRELAASYRGETSGRPAALPDLAVQYPDYARWQRAWLQGPVLDRLLSYWRAQLEGLEPLELPADRPPAQRWSSRGGTVSRHLGEPIAAALEATGRRHQATPFLVLLAAVGVLLHRLTGSRDLAVGVPFANRGLPELEPLVGFLVNTVVLRLRLEPGQEFTELVAGLRRTVLDAHDHQDLPFERLVEELKPGREVGVNPLFQVLLVHQANAGRRLELPGLDSRLVPLETRAAKLDLTIGLHRLADGLQVALEYNTDLFDATTAARMVARLETLLAAVAERPEAAIDALPAMARAERHQVLREWRDGRSQAALPALLHDLFVERARRCPDRVAVSAGSRHLTYAGLERRAAALARRLRGLGVGPETPVGLYCRRDLEMVVGVLGVLAAGGAYLPLDPAYPEERLGWMIADSRVPVVLASDDLAEAVPAGAARVLALGAAAGLSPAADPGGEAPRPTGPADPANLAYVLYTSGSTGRPKGVAVEHRSAVALVRWALRAFGATELHAVLAGTSINFDLSVFELFVPLAGGGRVVLVDDVLDLVGAAHAQSVTLVNTVPSAIAELARRRGIPGSVLTLNLAGEALQGSVVEEVRAASSIGRILNLYGPSEDTTYSTGAPCPGSPAAGPAPGRPRRGPGMGRPIDGTRVHAVDGGLRPVPLGATGELLLGGAGLARGYLGRPALTAERFVADPFAETPGARVYRTGDRVRFRPDGELDFLGRQDHQVKLRGFRIELDEVAAALRAHPRVGEAVVVLRGGDGDPRLVAYLVAEPAAEPPAAEDLRRFLGGRLPRYMIPALFVPLEALPRTASGKVDRRALPEPGKLASASRPAETPAEALLAALWSDLLGLDAVGARDGFFDLGGHSLHAARHVARLEELLGVRLPVGLVFEHPTVEELARCVEERLALEVLPNRAETAAAEPGTAWQSLPTEVRTALEERLRRARRGAGARVIPRRTDDGPAPLSWSQEILWYAESQAQGPSIYRLALTRSLRGKLDAGALDRAFAALAERHEILRVRFGATPEGQSFQVAEASIDLAPRRVDLAALPEERREAAARAVLAAETAVPFDLTRTPILRAFVLRLDEAHHWLHLAMHHIIMDDWSLGIFYRELSELYSAEVTGSPPALPPVDLRYSDYAAWDRQRIATAALAPALAYWRGRFADGIPQLRLRSRRPRLAGPISPAAFAAIRCPREVVSALHTLARRHEASLFMTLLAGFQVVLHRHSDQPDVVVAVPNANRAGAQTEQLLGCCINMLLMRTDLSGDPTLEEALGSCRATVLQAFEHQDLPFVLVAPDHTPPPDLPPGRPPFQALFSFQNAPASSVVLSGLEVEPVEVFDRDRTDLDLTLLIRDRGPGRDLEIYLLYDRELFDAADVDRLLADYRRVLEEMAHRPETVLSRLPG